jgi:6-phosphogluconolactonase
MALVAVCDSEDAALAFAAGRFTVLVQEAVAARGCARVCLTGGRSAGRLYEALADARRPWNARVNWPHVHLFWSDERHVPADHPDSNFGLARRTLLSRVAVPSTQVHRICTDSEDAEAAAREYEATLRNSRAAGSAPCPLFDVTLLSLGTDAHVASIFPRSPLLDSCARWVAAARPPHLDAWRITLTPAALLDARTILMLAIGGAKADAVHAALDLPDNLAAWPAQLLRGAAGGAEWIMDAAAAARRRAGAPA